MITLDFCFNLNVKNTKQDLQHVHTEHISHSDENAPCTELSHNFVHCSTEVCVDQFSHYSKFHSTPAPSCGAIHTFPAYSEFNPVLYCFFRS